MNNFIFAKIARKSSKEKRSMIRKKMRKKMINKVRLKIKQPIRVNEAPTKAGPAPRQTNRLLN